MSKRHVELDTAKKQTFFIARNTKYSTNCAATNGYRGPFSQVHHVLPCTSLNTSLLKYLDSKKDEAPLYNKALSRFTNWDVNTDPNLIGLPTELAYHIAWGRSPKRKPQLPKSWPSIVASFAQAIPSVVLQPRLPIHLPTNWGHVTYNGLVAKDLDEVWTELSVTAKEHEPVEATDLANAIQAISNAYKGNLEGKTQTRADWQNTTSDHAQFKLI